jgi:APA family basic amino acid/polyamine antiporter
MIGAGVFTTSGFALEALGDPVWVLVAWVAGGLIALCGAASYAGLALHIRSSGGEYVYLARVVHPLAGFVAGWVSLLAGFTAAIAFAALACEAYLDPLLPIDLPGGGIAAVLVLTAALLHSLRVSVGAVAQNLLVLLKLALIAAFIGVSFFVSAGSAVPNPAASVESLSAMSFAQNLVWISLSYSGFNAAVYIAGEAQNPRAVAHALWLGTGLVTVVYLLLNYIFVALPDAAAVSGRADVAAAAAEAIGGTALATMVRGIIVLALVTSVFSMLMAGPRVYARMADDGLLPAALQLREHGPRGAIAFQAVLAVAVIWLTDLKTLLSYLGFTLSLSAAAAVACLFLVHQRSPELPRPVGYPWMPAIFIAATVAMAVLAAMRQPVELAAALLTLASGAAVYTAIRRLISTTGSSV